MKIVNRIVTSLIAAATFPILLTQVFVTFILSVNSESTAYVLINLFMGKDNQFTSNRLGIQKTLIELFNIITGNADSPFKFDIKELMANLPEGTEQIKGWLIASLVMLLIAVIIVIVVIGCAVFTKAFRSIIALSLSGSLSFFLSALFFRSAGKPFTDGTVDIASVLSKLLMNSESTVASIASGLLEGAIKVDAFAMGGAVWGSAAIMFACAMWAIAYYVTLPEDEKPVKKEFKKIKKA